MRRPKSLQAENIVQHREGHLLARGEEVATPKHYAVHTVPAPARHETDVKVSKHDEEDTYLPAFRQIIGEGKAASVMCVYNSVNGQPGCANNFLLKDTLPGKWNFNGYVVSDCDAVANIQRGHQPSARPIVQSAETPHSS